MVEGGPIDYLTGDWLAELTMLILSRSQAKRAGGGYARTFVTQMEQVMGTCLDRGIKVVSNAGGLDPAGCAEAVQEVADRLGLAPRIGVVTGDDLLGRLDELVAGRSPARPPRHRRSRWATAVPPPVTANAYLGCWGIVEALGAGADIVITGRVTDAAIVMAPAAHVHGWPARTGIGLAGGLRGRARHRVRRAGHRRQLRLLHRDPRPAPRRLPDRRDRGRRLLGHHEASGHGGDGSTWAPSPRSCSTRSAASAT
jgi:hypothetical protein